MSSIPVRSWWDLAIVLVHPIVVAPFFSLLGPVHTVSEVIGRKFLLNDSLNLLLNLLRHLLGSGGDGKISVVKDSVVFMAIVVNVVVVVVSGKHLESMLVRGVAHGGLAGIWLPVERVMGATLRKLSVNATILTPSVEIVESSEVEVKVAILIELELLGDAVSHGSVHVPLVSINLEPMSGVGLHIEVIHVLNTFWA